MKTCIEPESRVAVISNGGTCSMKYYRNDTGSHIELYGDSELVERACLNNEDITASEVITALLSMSRAVIYARR